MLLTRQEKLDVLARASALLAQKAECRKYEESLLAFSEYMWPVVEPAIPMIKGWVLEAICEHLEAVTRGEIKRLLINVPPGFSKSLMTDVFWPAWEWGPRKMPWLRYVCASYSNHLTERDNMRCRNIVISDRYQRMWGDVFGISNEQFTKIKFANDKTGWKLATSVGGIGVGERGDRFIVDDANNTMEMESEVTRATTNMWFTEVVPDRLNSQANSAIVVIQQRLHEEDVSGVALSRNMGYTHLCIPMEYEPVPRVNAYVGGSIKTLTGDDADNVKEEDIFWEDPRYEDGELAWPERFPYEICRALERDKGPFSWSGQYQQFPVPRGGAIIKNDFWQEWDQPEYPSVEYVVASLDSAYTEKEENDPSAMTIWGLFRDENGNPKIILMYAWEERLQFYDLVQKSIESCKRFRADRLLVESKASGISVAQEIHRIINFSSPFGIELINPQRHGDKVARVHSIQHLFSDKMIYAPNKDFADKLIKQASIFPKGAHDDLVDSMSMALRYLRDAGFALRKEEASYDRDLEVMYRRKLPPLYPV